MTPDGPFTLDGYEVQQLLGYGATGEVWRARELATGDVVALKRLRPGADVTAVDLLRREATLLRTLDTPYVVRLRAVLGGDDDVVLVLDHAGGGTLAALLARRGTLEAGEVVTIAGPLAAALATAHRVGLVHGDVSPANVLFTEAGMPLLSDLGVARTAGERRARVDGTAEYADPAVVAGAVPDETADVWALAAVCHHMLAGSPPHEGDSTADVLAAAAEGGRAPLGLLAPTAPHALVEAVEAGLARDPQARPDAAAFASLLRRAHGAAPVRLSGAGAPAPLAPKPTTVIRSWSGEPDPPSPVRRRWRRRGARHGAGGPSGRGWLAAVLAVVLLGAGGLGWASGSLSRDATSARPALTNPEPVFLDVVRRLDRTRERAFATGDVQLLREVAAPGSAALRTDTAQLAALAQQGRTATGLRHEVVRVEVLDAGPESARLRVVDALPAYQVRRGPAVVADVPGRDRTVHVMTLVKSDAGWRLSEVRAEAG